MTAGCVVCLIALHRIRDAPCNIAQYSDPASVASDARNFSFDDLNFARDTRIVSGQKRH